MKSEEQNLNSGNSGFFANTIIFVKSLYQLLLTRAELASLEIREVQKNILKFALIFVFSLLAFGFAIAYWSFLVVVVAWPTWGWKILLLMAVIFTMVGIVMIMVMRSMVQQNRFSLNATLKELREDCDTLLKR